MDLPDFALLATEGLIILLVLFRCVRCWRNTAIQLGFEHLYLIVPLHYHCLLFLGLLCFVFSLSLHLFDVGLEFLDLLVFAAGYVLVLTLSRFFLLEFCSHFFQLVFKLLDPVIRRSREIGCFAVKCVIKVSAHLAHIL